MDTSKYNPTVIRDTFRFLVDEFGYTIVRDEELFHEDRPYAFEIEFAGNGRRVNLTYDYMENFFYFSIIRGINTRFPDDNNRENIVSFWRLFGFFDAALELKALQPHGQTCVEAANMNAKLLRKYAAKILRGEEWV